MASESENLGGVRVNEYWSTTGYSVPFLYQDSEDETVLFRKRSGVYTATMTLQATNRATGT